MPRKIDPTNIRTGTGAAADESIDNNALIQPTQGTDALRVHLLDQHDAHDAVAISVEDTAGNFTSDEVEGALAELAGASSTINQSRQLGWYEAGVVDFSTAVSDAGLTITLDDNGGANPWTAIISTGAVDVSGDSIVLPDNSTVWVYVDSATGALNSTGAAPDISVDEDVIVGRFTTLAGAVTAKEDGRFFIQNDNRKIDYSVRSDGTNTEDIHSEGAFASLEAAFLWLATYSGTGTTVSEKTRIVVRGTQTVSSTLTVPVDNLVLEGEGDAAIATGASVDPLIDLDGHDGVEIRRLSFICNHAGSVVVASDSGSTDSFIFEDCIIESLGSNWLRFADFNVGALIRSRFQNLQVLVGGANARGIWVDDPSRVVVKDCLFTVTGGSGITQGVTLGSTGGNPNQEGVVEGCRFTNFEESVRVLGENHQVFGCHIANSTNTDAGIIVDSGSTNCVVRDNVILPGADIDVGISVNATTGVPTTGITVKDNKLYAINTYGILVTGPVSDSTVKGNLVDAVIGSQEPTAEGIRVAISGERPEDIKIDGNFVKRCAEGIVVRGALSTRATATVTVANVGNVDAGDNITIGGVALVGVTGARSSGSNNFNETIGVDTAMAIEIAAAINDPENAFSTDIVHAEASGADVILYHARRGATGNGTTLTTNDATAFTLSAATLTGGQDLDLDGMHITNNTIENCALSQSGAGGDSFDGAGCKGIGLEWTYEAKVLDNLISETGIQLSSAGVPSFPSTTGADVESYGIYARNCSNTTVRGNTIINTVATGVTAAAAIQFDHRSTGDDPTFTVLAAYNAIEGNNITFLDEGNANAIGATATEYGIRVTGDLGTDDTTVTHALNGFRLVNNTVSVVAVDGISLSLGNRAQAAAWQVVDNTVTLTGQHGMYFLVEDPGAGTAGTSSITQFQVSRNSVSLVTGSGILFEGTRAVGVNRLFDIDVYDNQLGFITEHGIRITAVSGFLVVSNRVSRNILRTIGTDGATHYAISMEVADGGVGQQDRWSVLDNEIVDHLDSGEFAIYLSVTDENLVEWDVSGNRISGGGNTSSAGGGIQVRTAQTGGGAGIRQGKCLGNTILSTVDGIRVQARYEVDNLQIANNTIRIAGAGGGTLATSARTVYVRCGLDLGGSDAQNILITENVLDGGDGSRIGIGNDVRVDNVVFSNNTINTTDQTNDPVSDGYTRGGYAAFSINQQSVLTGTAMSNVVIEGNTIRDVQREAIHVSQTLDGLSRLIEGLHIKNNSIYNAGIVNDQRGILVVYANNLLGTDGVRNLQITGNSFESISFTNNQGSPCPTGLIYVEAAPDGFRVSDNTFAECSVESNSTSDNNFAGAILIYTDATNDLRNGMVSGNTFRNVDVTADSASTTQNVNAGLILLRAAGQNLVSVQVTGNNAHSCAVAANSNNASAVARAGIYWFRCDIINGLQIHDNETVFCTATATNALGDNTAGTIYLFGGTITRDLSISDNLFRDVDGSDAVIYSLNALQGCQVTDNVATECDSTDFWQHNAGSDDVTNVVFTTNRMVRSTDAVGIGVFLNTTGVLVSVDVRSNHLVGYSTLADLNAAGRANYLNVVGNYVNFSSSTVITQAISVFVVLGDGDVVGNWDVSHNTINGAQTSGISLIGVASTIGDVASLSKVTILGNQIAGSATSDGILVQGTRVNMTGVNVSSNHLSGGTANGISVETTPGSDALDSALFLERVIVTHNTVDDWGEGSLATVASRDYAIRVRAATSGGASNVGSLRDVTVSHNMMEGSQDNQGGVRFDADGNIRGLIAIGNVLRYDSGTAGQTGFAFNMQGGIGGHFAHNHVQQANTVYDLLGSGFTYSTAVNNSSLTVANDDWANTGTTFIAAVMSGGTNTTTGNVDG